MIEELLKTLCTDIGRIASGIELLTTQNAQLLGSVTTGGPEPEAPKTGKGKTGTSKVATPKAAEEPEPEPVVEEPVVEEPVTADQVRATFQVATKADKVGANKAFEDFKAETGINKVSECDEAQRAELKARFDAVIAAAEM